MSRLLTALILALALAPAGIAQDNRLQVRLRAQATPAGRVVTVGDVADVSGGSPEMRTTVVALDLAEAPAARSTLRVTGRQVGFRLRLADLPEDRFEVTGVSDTLVLAPQCHITETEVRSAAVAAIRSRCLWPSHELAVDLAQPLAALPPIDAARVDVRLHIEPPPAVTTGRHRLQATVFVRGETRQIFAVHVTVHRHGGSPVDGGPVTPASFTPPSPAAAPATVGGPPVIRSNEPVRLVVHLGPIDVTATGIALQEGAVGQTVRVRNQKSQQIILGKVTAPGIVEIVP
jgi:alkylated DNA nucleotide flippase Atl1